ncbi:MAG: pyridinium-3,5-bisthiocarboxylic acid mononucleotide nickel chelatase [Gemmatimonadaceae bacterium]|nr:pyridinium-3,5-bisthiocarboxylic acid mononucleotide nickel chelatase [Gemmatimonadaceae bacterium]
MRDAGCKFDSPSTLSGATPSPSFELRDDNSFAHSKQMKVAILDPASGIAGDMFLGALVDVGLDKAWLERLPSALGLPGVEVRIKDVERSHVHCVKVDFEIPHQPHGRAVSEIHRMIDAVKIPEKVARLAHAAFDAIAEIESAIHGVTPDELHLHEVGAVDAILDIVGSIWGVELLGIERIYNTKVSLGEGTVKTAHGVLPVPAPATIRLLEGFNVRHGPPGSGELTTPTGAALLKVLSKGEPPDEYKPSKSGYGAGTRDIHGQLNALRIILGEAAVGSHDHHQDRDHVHTEHLHVLSADIDDMSPEEVAGAAELLRADGALDVVLLHTTMKKGRLGTRVDALVRGSDLARLEEKIFLHFSTLGVKTFDVVRSALTRESKMVRFDGRDIRVKVATLPDGSKRAKPEFDDLRRVAEETSRPLAEIRSEVLRALGDSNGKHATPRGK